MEPTRKRTPLELLAITALGLVLPSLLASVALPGLDLEHFHEVFGLESRIDASMTAASLLLVPWVSAALLVQAIACVVPAWRRPVRSARAARGLSWAAWIVGGLALLSQVLGLTLYLTSADFLIDEPWAPWLAGATMLAASLGTRVMAVLISRRGLGDGMSVMLAGEFLLRLAENLRQHGAEWSHAASEQTPLTLVLTLGGVFAMGAWLSGWFAPRLQTSWSVMPMTTPVGLVPAGLAAGLMPFVFPAAGAPSWSPWSKALDSLISLPLHGLLPGDGEIALSTTAALAVVVALVVTPPRALDRIVASLNLRHAPARSWFWVATFASTTWLLLLARASVLTGTGALLPWLFVVVFVARDLWTEWRLRARGEVVAIARLNHVVAACAVSRVLTPADIPHALRGMGLRALFHGFVPFSELELLVPAAEAERAAAELTPLLEADRARVLSPTR